MSTPNLTAADGEVYVALADTTQVFPAVIEDECWSGFAVPRFRRPVAEAVVLWLNEMHEQAPDDWPDTASFDGDVLTLLETYADMLFLLENRVPNPEETEVRPNRIEPDEKGRYAIGREWPWELTAPPSDAPSDAALLADSARLVAEGDEILVTINIDGTDPAFPALASEIHGWSRAGCPRFRRTVAEVVVAWISDTARKYPEGSDLAYWDGDTIVMVDHQAIGEDGYLPARITAADDGRFSIGATFEWERAD